MHIKSSSQHGGDIKTFSEQIGSKPSEVIDLSSNINFIKPNINIDFNSLDISAYPTYEKLTESIAKLYTVKASEMELFNGATTAIYTLFRHLSLNHCTLYAPLYVEYEKASSIYNYQINYINRLDNINQEVKENSLVIFVNPSTPDGKYYDLDKLIKKWIEKRCTILIDESFLDFSPFKSALPYINTYDKLYILKSMTKFYSSAGIRVGALISNQKNIQNIKSKEPLWKISQFDSHYLQSALSDKTFPAISKEFNNKNKEYLIKILENSKFIQKVYPSSANFIMIKLKNLSAQEFQEKLIPYKIMIRDCYNFKFLDKTYVRIAVKSKQALKELEKAL
ncbi:L-threonine 3-O-phosphate decarboxylase [hydrothermal vent metagenome]|uniref:L-threonine 3-O-phosphate decarboxylase n=1 Tax=hydrothermal vent metagenome TaxID=652676 RepID=A0A1W1C2Y8_9ZZZZ